MMDNKQIANILIDSGYRRISNKFRMISRVDKDISRYSRSTAASEPDYYRRCYSKEKLVVPYAISRLIPSSCHDPIGYVAKHEKLDDVIKELNNYDSIFNYCNDPGSRLLDKGAFKGTKIKDAPIAYLKNLLTFLKNDDCLKLHIEYYLNDLGIKYNV